MANKKYFFTAVLIIVTGLILMFYFVLNYSQEFLLLSLFLFVVGIFMLLHWSTVSYKWKCKNCNNIFDLSMWNNLKALNIGVNKKKIFCPYCNCKTTFVGIRK